MVLWGHMHVCVVTCILVWNLPIALCLAQQFARVRSRRKTVTHTWLAMKLMHSLRERPQLHAFEWLDSHGMRRSYVIIRNHADGIMSKCIIRLRLTTAGAGHIDFRFISLFHLIYRIPRLRTSGFVAKFHCVCNMSLKTYSSRVTVMFATKSSKRSSSNRTCRFYTRFFTIKYYPEPHSTAVYMVACTSQTENVLDLWHCQYTFTSYCSVPATIIEYRGGGG